MAEKILVGEDIYIAINEFRGKKTIMIRRFYDDKGEMKPGKQGINLQLEEWEDFVANLEDIQVLIKEGMK